MAVTVRRPVRRSIAGVERGRDVVLTLYPGGVLGFRVKRCRREWLLPVVAAYQQAVKRELACDRAARDQVRRRERRRVRRGGQ